MKERILDINPDCVVEVKKMFYLWLKIKRLAFLLKKKLKRKNRFLRFLKFIISQLFLVTKKKFSKVAYISQKNPCGFYL